MGGAKDTGPPGTDLCFTTEPPEVQLKCDELEKQKKDSDSHCAALEKEKKDIVDYLKHSVLEKEDEAQELSERLESQRQASDQAREALRLQHERLRQELRARIEELTGENGTLATRLAVLEEFQEQKEQLMSNMASLEKQLVSLKEEHKADVHSLEMKALLEKRSLEKEMESHAAATAAQLGHLVDQRVPEATRRALRENAEASARCGQLSEQAHALMKENAALRDRKSQLAVDVDILEQMLGELSRKSCVRKKVMEQLTEKCRQLQTELELCRQEHRQLHAKHKLALARTETLRFTEFIEFIRSYRALDSSYPRSRSFKGVQEQCRESRAEASQLEAELLEERRMRSRMKSVTQEAAVTVRRALMEASDVGVVPWKQLMLRLLVVLDGPTLGNFSAEEPAEPQTSDAAAAGPGDLGLAPPSPPPKHSVSGSGRGFVLPLHRKPSGQKTSISVHPSDSAIRLETFRHLVNRRK
ncbi:Hypothetical protein SMAX5B_019347 [Scophthalmus maximus]|uniref:Cilia- and flagella-associated protein 157 n=1 Tax=Scophthalmus maximus TaxID=52904 RepID=A0A2U9BTS6_SCOMX|nr:Hypothetical protein SMAX5B_019347 [Scophthalmus maximus]